MPRYHQVSSHPVPQLQETLTGVYFLTLSIIQLPRIISIAKIYTLTSNPSFFQSSSTSSAPQPSLNNSTPTIQLSRLARRLKRPIRQQPQPLRRTLPGRNPRDIMSSRLHIRDGAIIIRRLKANHVRYQLIMEPRLR